MLLIALFHCRAHTDTRRKRRFMLLRWRVLFSPVTYTRIYIISLVLIELRRTLQKPSGTGRTGPRGFLGAASDTREREGRDRGGVRSAASTVCSVRAIAAETDKRGSSRPWAACGCLVLSRPFSTMSPRSAFVGLHTRGRGVVFIFHIYIPLTGSLGLIRSFKPPKAVTRASISNTTLCTSRSLWRTNTLYCPLFDLHTADTWYGENKLAMIDHVGHLCMVIRSRFIFKR